MSDDIQRKMYALMAHTEEQQQALDKALQTIERQQEHLDIIQNGLPELAKRLFKDASKDVRDSIESDLHSDHYKLVGKLKQATNAAMKTTQVMEKTADDVVKRYIIGFIVGFFILCLLIMMCVKLFIPSLDEVNKRQAIMEAYEKQENTLMIGDCNGEVCVRIDKNQCGQSVDGYYCIADLK